MTIYNGFLIPSRSSGRRIPDQYDSVNNSTQSTARKAKEVFKELGTAALQRTCNKSPHRYSYESVHIEGKKILEEIWETVLNGLIRGMRQSGASPLQCDLSLTLYDNILDMKKVHQEVEEWFDALVDQYFNPLEEIDQEMACLSLCFSPKEMEGQIDQLRRRFCKIVENYQRAVKGLDAKPVEYSERRKFVRKVKPANTLEKNRNVTLINIQSVYIDLMEMGLNAFEKMISERAKTFADLSANISSPIVVQEKIRAFSPQNFAQPHAAADEEEELQFPFEA